jgi:hypothetical protein
VEEEKAEKKRKKAHERQAAKPMNGGEASEKKRK